MKQIKTFLIFVILLCIANLAYAENTITNIKIHTAYKKISVSAELKDGFNSEVVETIQSGITATLTYSLLLKAKRHIFWFDENIARVTINKTVKYDTLNKEYYLADMQKNAKNKKETTKDINRLIEWITHIEDITITTPIPLSPDNEYYLQIKAEMATKKMWLPFRYIFFFMQKEDINTGWIETKIK